MPGSWLRRLHYWLRRSRLEDELREEIETHRSLRQDALAHSGTDSASASRRAMGNVTLAREEARDGWSWAGVDDLARDVRHAFTGLRRRPAFAAVSILTIAVGTGTLASVLSVVFTVLLRPAPYPTADRIVQIGQFIGGRNRSEVSTADVRALREASRSLSHTTIAWFSEANVAGDGLPERARRVYTDWQAFELLGVPPVIGRLPTSADEAPGADPVVVIGFRLWSERFRLARDVIGRPLRVDGQPYTIVAVMPLEFRFPAPYWAAGDLWLLRGPSHPSWPTSRDPTVLAFGLMKPDATLEHAQAEADVIAASLDARSPSPGGSIGLRLTTWAGPVKSTARPRLLLILGAALIVFLIVVMNVTNLVLSRGAERQPEFAARIALGAGRARLARQLLTEATVMFAIGGVLGLVLAVWGSRLIVAMRSYSIPRMEEAVVDGAVAAVVLAITFAAALAVGVASALQARTARLSTLAEASARGASRARRWRACQRTLVATEVALALVLLCGAAMLLDSARTLSRVDPGFDARGVLHVRVSLPPEKYESRAAQVDFYERVVDGLLAVPGVEAAAAVNVPPGVGGDARRSVVLDDDPAPSSPAGMRMANIRVVTPRYFETLGLVPRAGRVFSTADAPSMPLALVNETFSRQYFDGRMPIGRTLRVSFRGIAGLDATPRTIVGVVPDIREKTLYEPAPPTVYLPVSQADWRVGLRMALLVRSSRASADLNASVRATVASVDREQAAFGLMPLTDLMASELSLHRLNLALLSVLSGVALFLAVVGVYGMSSQSVRQRTREIGIRTALGASPSGILRMVLLEGATLTLAGLVGGALISLWTVRLLPSTVNSIGPAHAGTFVWAGLVLAGAVIAGCYVPARRAARIDPAIVLRSE